jgi:acetyl-CoA carboxylase biotin carboxylase subunit
VSIRRILIANRGEIAIRIIRTCRELRIETVLAVVGGGSRLDAARLADRTICIGPARPADSYLKVEAIVQAALGVHADAIHPAMVSLRAARPRPPCEQNGIVFIGPTAAQIEAVADKLQARSAAEAAGIPVVPGGAVDSVEAAVSMARLIGCPLLVKAVGGGGGRGMKRVERMAELPSAMALAASEAGAAFGDARVYLERLVTRARHIEVQVLGDGEGRVIHLGERDCSIQRRYQKLIEESPAPELPEPLSRQLHDAAVRFAERLSYRGAGTVEFLVDGQQAFYFLEMNARIQVEHPVTEAVTGLDLVAEQIAIADGAGLRLSQSDVHRGGCAIECRVNAEDPATDFRPSPGLVTEASWPSGPGVRVDTHIAAGSRVSPYYDSLMAKIIVHAADRQAALGG